MGVAQIGVAARVARRRRVGESGGRAGGGSAYGVVRRAFEPSSPPLASRSAELGEVRSGHASRMRMLGDTAHRDGRQTAADTRRGVARLRRCRRAPVPLPFTRARWRASVIVAPSSRSRPGNKGGEPRYARSSQLVDSRPFDVPSPSSPPPSPPPHRRPDNGRAAVCTAASSPLTAAVRASHSSHLSIRRHQRERGQASTVCSRPSDLTLDPVRPGMPCHHFIRATLMCLARRFLVAEDVSSGDIYSIMAVMRARG